MTIIEKIEAELAQLMARAHAARDAYEAAKLAVERAAAVLHGARMTYTDAAAAAKAVEADAAVVAAKSEGV